MKNKITLLVLLLVCTVALSVPVVRASSDSMREAIISGSIDRIVEIIMNGEAFSLGARSDADTEPTYLDDGEWTYIGDVYADDMEVIDDLYVRDDVAVTDDLTVSGEIDAKKIYQGGTVTDATSTMEIAFALTAAQICDSAVITVNSGCSADTAACAVAASLDITMAATSTLFADCLDEDGKSVEFIFYNSSPTAASSTQIVAGTGGFLYEPDGQDVVVNGSNAVKIRLQRVDGFESNEDLMIFVDEHIAG